MVISKVFVGSTGSIFVLRASLPEGTRVEADAGDPTANLVVQENWYTTFALSVSTLRGES